MKQSSVVVLTAIVSVIVLVLTGRPVVARGVMRSVISIPMDSPQGSLVDPKLAMGAGLDGQEEGDIDLTFAPPNIRAMDSVGLQSLTYRLRTELGCEAWHWNPVGQWSDPLHHQGYWTSSAVPGAPIQICNGYRLPRRGNTGDQANNDGYSRLDDGDRNTFWKSNPYLDQRYTGDDNSLHPNWVLMDLASPKLLNAIRICWADPYAVEYRVEYWDGDNDIGENDEGEWRAFPYGVVTNGRGGDAILKLCAKPIKARFVRIVMTKGSGTHPVGALDPRDSLGVAIREIYLGRLLGNGRFLDVIHHSHNSSHQTVMYTSSTDPWHRAIDRDPMVEQAGLDLFFHCGLTHGLPALVPVGVLYDTPENGAALLSYLMARHYPIRGIELGEEPDGQYVSAQDYAALYLQMANALRKVNPDVLLGGPSLMDADIDVVQWPVRTFQTTWLQRVVRYLRSHGRPADPGFVSFEWYPFDDVCTPPTGNLVNNPDLLSATVKRVRHSGIGVDTPLMITEFGYSAFAGEEEVDISGALMNAETVAEFLSLGGSCAYLFGYPPATLIQEVNCTDMNQAWGNNMLFLSNDDGTKILYHMPTYYGAWMLTHLWIPQTASHWRVFRVKSQIHDRTGKEIVTAYVAHALDGKAGSEGRWNILLLNKDPRHEHYVRLQMTVGQKATHDVLWTELTTYGQCQYHWHADGENGRPSRDLPPQSQALHLKPGMGGGLNISLPAESLTVVSGCGIK